MADIFISDAREDIVRVTGLVAALRARGWSVWWDQEIRSGEVYAKHTQKVGTPTYGFSPLRLKSDDRFLELFHGVDERVSLDGLRFGLPVLYDVVRVFCGARVS